MIAWLRRCGAGWRVRDVVALHFSGIDPPVRQRVVLERGYGEEFGVT